MTRCAWPLLLLAGCGFTDAPPPPTNDYPCGILGVVCTTQHTCCNQGETCGGEPASVGCPLGLCCDIENSVSEFTMRLPRKQRPFQ